jgi:DNA-binding transcriptional LysR family regulator
MSRSGFIEFEAAIAVARFRNFRAAAADLGMSPTALSSTIRGLEARIGVQIFRRTTRSVALTAAGNAFIERISSTVADINEAIRIAQGHATDLTGALRINSSITAAHEILTPLIHTGIPASRSISSPTVASSTSFSRVLTPVSGRPLLFRVI